MKFTSSSKEKTHEPAATTVAVLENGGLDPTRAPKDDSEKDPSIDSESGLLTGWKLASVFSGMLLSVFLVALDQSIVATAIPRIASEFNALDQLSWIASGYFLTQAGLLLTFGQFLTVAANKHVYLVAIFLFELGSLFCGVAPSVEFLIFGRAVAGCGAAGIFISVLSVIAIITKLEDRPLFFGGFGAVFALSSVAGPLLGGAFTDHVTWRWCFYINLPIGAISFVSVIFLLKATPPPERSYQKGLTKFQRWLGLDWVGTVLSMGLITSLLLALQWGGNEKPWDSREVIALFCVFAVLLPMFLYWEYRRGENAILPLSMLKRKTQIGCCIEAFFVFLGLLVGIYYLPLWYQATRGHSATKSGLDILAFQISCVVAAGMSGAIINKIGRYWPFLFFSPLLFSIGSGLLYTVDETTSTAKLIGYQILVGVGIGASIQNAVIAIQAEYADDEAMVPQATSLVSFTQLLGGIVGIAIAGTIFANQLQTNLAIYAPNLPPEVALGVRQKVTLIYEAGFPPDQRAAVIKAYVKSLDPVFLIGVPGGAFGTLASLLIANYHLKERSAAFSGGGGH